MGKNVNVQKGKKGFQKTAPKAVLPLGEKRGFFGKINKNSVPLVEPDAPLESTATGRLYAHYSKIQETLEGEIKCKYCGKKTLHKLMKEPSGEIVCQLCSSGGEGDNFIKSGEWIAPSPQEVRKSVKEDLERKNK